MSYAILRVAKIKTSQHLTKAFMHNMRTARVTNADPEMLKKNEVLVPCDDVHSAWEAKVAGKTVRKNAVLAVEVVLARSPEWVGDEAEWVKRSQAWLEERFGADNVLSSVVHRDEQTPHLQALVVPIDTRGNLNCRAFLGGTARLVALQDSYAEAMAPLGLVRGKRGSMATHQELSAFYTAVREAQTVALAQPASLLGMVRAADAERVVEQAKAAQVAAEAARHEAVIAKRDAEAAGRAAEFAKAERRMLADMLRVVPLAEVMAKAGAEQLEKHKWRFDDATYALASDGASLFHVVSGGAGGGKSGGRGAIDLVQRLFHSDFNASLAWLAEQFGVGAAAAEVRSNVADRLVVRAQQTCPSPTQIEVPQSVPERWPQVREYLCRVRRVATPVVEALHAAGRLWADWRGNCVFPHAGPTQSVVGAELRGTTAEKWRGARGRLAGYYVPGQRAGLIVCESAIDAMSAVELTQYSAVSVGGANSRAAEAWAVWGQLRGEVYAGQDADVEGERQAEALIHACGWVRRMLPPQGKDWNEALSHEPEQQSPRLKR